MNLSQFDRKFKMKINDDTWHFILITEEEALDVDREINDLTEGFRALTLTGDDGRAIFIVEGSVTKGVINHELFHLYVSYFHLDSANIEIEDFEEVVAEFLESNLDKFIRIRNKIYNKLKKLEGS